MADLISVAVTLDEVEQRGVEGISELLLSPLDALSDIPRVMIEGEACKRLLNGVPPTVDEIKVGKGSCRRVPWSAS